MSVYSEIRLYISLTTPLNQLERDLTFVEKKPKIHGLMETVLIKKRGERMERDCETEEL